MACRQVSAGDGDEAGEARFRGQKIVVISLQTAVSDAISDRQKLTLGVQQEGEAHLVEQPSEAGHQRPQPGGQIHDTVGRHLGHEAAPMPEDGRLQRLRPDHRLDAGLGIAGIGLGHALHERHDPLGMRRQCAELRQDRLS